jgi:hypothetical protein
MIPTRTIPVRGVTLLIAVILSSVVLSVALALLDISYKQILLASSAKQSQYAFYSADSVMECGLYWDQQKDAFDFTATSYLTSGISCSDPSGTAHTIVPTTSLSGTTRTSVVTIPCTPSGTAGTVTIYKAPNGDTSIFATGYSTCDASDPRRIERGLKVTYGTGGSGGSGGGGGGGGPGPGAELIPLSFSISSDYGYTGGSVPGGLRDGIFNASNSVYGTNGGANPWITADLGSVQTVGHIEVAPITQSFDTGWGAYYLNNSSVQYSTDNATWTTVGVVSGTADNTYGSVSLGSVSARYIRITKASAWLGVGDFKVFAP